MIAVNVSSLSSIDWIFRPYYVCLIWGLILMCLFSIKTSILEHKFKHLLSLLVLSGISFSFFILTTDIIVEGVVSIGYSATAIKGEMFGVFLVFSSACLLFIVVILSIGIYKAQSDTSKNNCLWALLALMPIIIVGASISILLSFNIKINFAGILPIATSLFLIVMLKTEDSHNLSDFRRFLPLSLESKTSRKASQLFSKYTMDEISYKELKIGVEIIATEYKFLKKGNVSQAAISMDLNRSTVSNLVSRHNLKL